MRRRTATPLLILALLASALAAGCTAASVDSDGDSMRDVDEREQRSILLVTPDGDDVRKVTSDPDKKDTDGDGATDFEEFSMGTDPRDVDSDRDGLLDAQSIRAESGSKRYELFKSRGIVEDPADPGLFLGEASLCKQIGGLDPTHHDSDRPLADGLSDGDEVRGWEVTVRHQARHVTSDPCNPDGDGDLMQDGAERDAGTDPLNENTDGDDAIDSVDADPLWNVGVKLTLVDIQLKQNKDVTGGADLRFTVNAAGVQKTFNRDVGATGTHALGFTTTADVDDSSPTPDALTAFAVVQVRDADDAGGSEPVRVAGSEGTARLELGLFNGGATANGQSAGDGFEGRTEGQDAVLRFTFETTRS